ncbi:MAG: acyl-CoA synthetase [Nocardioides sp.]|nr:acyl-CoA synthetase [Nocardioides sp.]
MIESYASLTPVLLLDRAAQSFAERTAVVDGDVVLTYREFAARCERLSGALIEAGIRPGDRVGALCSNSHVMLEVHFGALLAGAVLVPMNTRLAGAELAYVLKHSGARLLVTTSEFAAAGAALADSLELGMLAEGEAYEHALTQAEPRRVETTDERALMSINYTSGTTGRSKGVMYHHRGAFLQSVAMAYHTALQPGTKYLWTLPMFHCHGWSFPFAVTGAGGTHVCLRSIDLARIWEEIRGGATHFSAAPTVLTMIADHAAAGAGAPHPVAVTTGGAPPTPTLLERMAALNLHVTHAYGLTETFGPVMVNQWQPEWDERSAGERASMTARQGIANLIARPPRVVDAEGRDVADDGIEVGELLIRGNDVMLGYYRDEESTRAASHEGWFRTGDLAVMHPDGYVEIRDRLKDVIISGGENIASVEVERALDSHPAVSESAVVGRADDHWGQVPVAFVNLRPGAEVTVGELQDHVRTQLARYKVPKVIHFGELPKTTTGKVQKNVLRTSGGKDAR